MEVVDIGKSKAVESVCNLLSFRFFFSPLKGDAFINIHDYNFFELQ